MHASGPPNMWHLQCARRPLLQRLLNQALKEWQVSHPQLAAWAEKNRLEGFAVFDLHQYHRVRILAEQDEGWKTAKIYLNMKS